MIFIKIIFFSSLLFVFHIQFLLAAPQMGSPQYEGSGCLPGTLQTALSPDGTSLSVLFDHFKVEAGKGIAVGEKSCSLSIPFSLPDDTLLIIVQADYRGFNSLPKGASSRFQTFYQFSLGSRKQDKHQIKFKGPLTEEFINTDIERVKSPCGGSVTLNISSLLSVQTNSQQEEAFSQIDTSDLVGHSILRKPDRKLKYQILMKKCRE